MAANQRTYLRDRTSQALMLPTTISFGDVPVCVGSFLESLEKAIT